MQGKALQGEQERRRLVGEKKLLGNKVNQIKKSDKEAKAFQKTWICNLEEVNKENIVLNQELQNRNKP